MILTLDELETLEEALGEHMTDGYGQDNEEGCWTDDQWAELQDLSMKLTKEICNRRRNSA